VFGIGTNLVTCQAQPALGMVYKICSLGGVARIKLSEEAEKTTIPANKVVMRAFVDTTPVFDLLCLQSELETMLKTDSPITAYTRQMEKKTLEFSQLECISTRIFPEDK